MHIRKDTKKRIQDKRKRMIIYRIVYDWVKVYSQIQVLLEKKKYICGKTKNIKHRKRLEIEQKHGRRWEACHIRIQQALPYKRNKSSPLTANVSHT